MILNLHSFSNPIKVNTEDIKAFIWSIELAKVELVIDGASKPLPIDEELIDLEQMYQDWNVQAKKRKV